MNGTIRSSSFAKSCPVAPTRATGFRLRGWQALPDSVLNRAKEILNNLEKAELNAEGVPKLSRPDGAALFAKARRKKIAIRQGLGQMDLL